MHQRKYFTLNFFINEIFSAEKIPNYGKCLAGMIQIEHTLVLHVPNIY